MLCCANILEVFFFCVQNYYANTLNKQFLVFENKCYILPVVLPLFFFCLVGEHSSKNVQSKLILKTE